MKEKKEENILIEKRRKKYSKSNKIFSKKKAYFLIHSFIYTFICEQTHNEKEFIV